MRDVLVDAGHTVDCRRVYHVEPNELGNCDLVVLGSNTWDNWVSGRRTEGQLQEHMRAFVERIPSGALAERRVAVFSLGDSSYNRFCGAADILEELVTKLGAVKVGDTLRVDGFFSDPVRNRRRMADWTRSLATAA